MINSIAEVSFRRERFARRTLTPPTNFDERIVVAAIDAAVADERGSPENDPIYEPDPDRCQAAHAFADGIRRAGEVTIAAMIGLEQKNPILEGALEAAEGGG